MNRVFSACKYTTVRLYWMSIKSVVFLCVTSVQTECSEGLSNRIKKTAYSTPGTAVPQWLRCCATNQKVTGSIPAGVIGIFH